MKNLAAVLLICLTALCAQAQRTVPAPHNAAVAKAEKTPPILLAGGIRRLGWTATYTRTVTRHSEEPRKLKAELFVPGPGEGTLLLLALLMLTGYAVHVYHRRVCCEQTAILEKIQGRPRAEEQVD